MADTKISSLSEVTDLLSDDEFVLARSGTTKKITALSLIGGFGFSPVYDSTLGSDTANFDVTSIPGTFSALRWMLTGRGTAAANQIEIRVRANNDSGNNYEWQRPFSHTGNTYSGAQGSAQAYCYAGELAGDSSTAGRAGTLEGYIHNYAGTTYNKTFHIHGGRVAALHLWEEVVGAWLSTSAVTQLTFFPASDNFKTGTRLTLWGVT